MKPYKTTLKKSSRQKHIPNCIVDFYCARARLVLDGGQHVEENHRNKDKARGKALSSIRLLVLRYGNYQVLMETDSVSELIHSHVENRIKHGKQQTTHD